MRCEQLVCSFRVALRFSAIIGLYRAGIIMNIVTGAIPPRLRRHEHYEDCKGREPMRQPVRNETALPCGTGRPWQRAALLGMVFVFLCSGCMPIRVRRSNVTANYDGRCVRADLKSRPVP